MGIPGVWQAPAIAAWHQARVSNGPTEAINNLVKRVRCVVFEFPRGKLRHPRPSGCRQTPRERLTAVRIPVKRGEPVTSSLARLSGDAAGTGRHLGGGWIRYTYKQYDYTLVAWRKGKAPAHRRAIQSS